MFLLALTGMTAVLGARLCRQGLGSAVILWHLLSMGFSVALARETTRFRFWDPVVTRWIAEQPAQTEISEVGHRVFTLLPEVNALPTAPSVRHGRRIDVTASGCPATQPAGWRLLRQIPMAPGMADRLGLGSPDAGMGLYFYGRP